MTAYKAPRSVLVVIHTPDFAVLLMERARHPGFWQSVTGSCEEGEDWAQTARREVAEETGIFAQPGQLIDWRIENRYPIHPAWRVRYAPAVTHNVEHVFGLCVAAPLPPRLAPDEHRAACWLPRDEAAARCFSWSNQDAILLLPQFTRST